jgi:gamma-glutamyltranspeptidase / glutathione hydrolase
VRRRGTRVIALLTVLGLAGTAAALAAGVPGQGARFRPAVSGSLGVIATESPAAARVGRAVLESGGNAVDAAAATVFAVNVARPQSCGIGGGGFMVYRSPSGKTASLDFREKAPAAFTPRILQPPGPHDDYTGHLSVGVPGTLAGMAAALRRYGTTSLREAMAPAERLARRGVTVTPALARAMKENAKRLRLFPAAARQFLVRGKRPYRAGAKLRQPLLAATLHRIRRFGTRAFYRGVIAKRIVDDSRRAGKVKRDRGVLRLRDLRAYRAKWRTPLTGSFLGRQVVAMPPPTSGGVAIIEMLNILSGYDLARTGYLSADSLHLIAEAQKLAWADRDEYLADPDFVKVPTTTLISIAHAARRRALIDPARSKVYKPGLGSEQRRGSTTQISVVDRRGGAVSLTCTIEQEFGSAVVAPGTGFLLNNEMTDFGDPGTANEPRAGKRPRSSMSPTIVVEGGKPIIVTGGAGGSQIVMGAFTTILDRLVYGLDLAHAVDAPRIDAQVEQQEKKGKLLIEDKRIAPAVLAELRRRGHRLDRQGAYGELPRVQAAGFRTPGTELKDAVSDPRTEAASLAQRPRLVARRGR